MVLDVRAGSSSSSLNRSDSGVETDCLGCLGNFLHDLSEFILDLRQTFSATPTRTRAQNDVTRAQSTGGHKLTGETSLKKYGSSASSASEASSSGVKRRISTTVLGTPQNCSEDYRFDNIQLAIYWVPGFCRLPDSDCVPGNGAVFSIHGLWPTRNRELGPEYCCHKKDWDPRWLKKKLRPQLSKHWKIRSASRVSWWPHQWKKHGTCFKEIPALEDPKDYFQYSLELIKKFDLLNHLKNLNIQPKDDKPYKSKDLREALGKIANKNVRLVSKKDISGRHILSEVRFCFDKQLEHIDCDYDHYKRMIYFPATY